MLLNSAQEDKSFYNKDEALIRMIAFGNKMKKANGTQFYCYRDGVFYVSQTIDFKESIEFNTNDSSVEYISLCSYKNREICISVSDWIKA